MTTRRSGPESAGYSGTPLAKKLGIRDGHVVGWEAAPPGFAEKLDLGPAVVTSFAFDGRRRHDVIVAFARDRDALEGTAERLAPSLKWNGGLWLAWPKKRSPLATDVRDSHVRRAGLEAGLVDNKVCAVDEDWSALRFVYRKADRPGRPDRPD